MSTAAYVPKDWGIDDDITEVALDHIEQGIKAATDGVRACETEIDTVNATLGAEIDTKAGLTVQSYAWQELSSNLGISGAGWQAVNGNGISYLPLGAAEANDFVNVTALVRHGDKPIAIELRNGASTVIRKFTRVTGPYELSISYPFSGAVADLRAYLLVYTNGGSDTLYGLNGTEQYTMFTGQRYHSIG